MKLLAKLFVQLDISLIVRTNVNNALLSVVHALEVLLHVILVQKDII